MSTYLITEIDSLANITVRTGVELVDGVGRRPLEALVLEDVETGSREEVPADVLFVLIGSVPRTDYLGDEVRCDRGV